MTGTVGALLADDLRRGLLAIVDVPMRDAWLADRLHTLPPTDAAAVLDAVCQGAEQASPHDREVLLSVVRVLLGPDAGPLVESLRRHAASSAHLALGRFLRWPTYRGGHAPLADPEGRAVPLSSGRTLTLGERKSLARRPDRRSFDLLLRDPHPAVIHMLLANPRLTEDDVLRLAARRPAFPDVLALIARSPRWSARPRVRVALVINPSTPPEIAVPMVLLLVKPELQLVVELTDAKLPVRAAALELLRRRPPQLDDRPPDEEGQVQ